MEVALAALQAELGAQRALISTLSSRVGELHALVTSGALAASTPGEVAGEVRQPPGAAAAPGRAASDGSDGDAAAATAAAAAASARPGAPGALQFATLATTPCPFPAGAAPTAATLRLSNTAPLLPEYYLREHNGTIAARIVDAAGLPLSVRAMIPKPPTAGGAASAANAPAASMPDGTVLRVHLEREGGTTPSGRALAGAPDRPPLLSGEETTVVNGRATFPELRVTDSTYNLIKKAPAVLVVTAPHAPWLTPALSVPFRVLTKRSLSDKKSGPARAGGARRPRSGAASDVAASDAVEALPGLGSRSAQRLRAAGIGDCGTLARRIHADEAEVRHVLGDLGSASKHWRSIMDAIASLVAEQEPAQPTEKRRRRTAVAAADAAAAAAQAQAAATAAAQQMVAVAARSAQDYGWAMDQGGGSLHGHMSVGSLFPPSGLFGLEGSRGGGMGMTPSAAQPGSHQAAADAAAAAGQLLYDPSVYATLAALLGRGSSMHGGGSVHGGSSNAGGAPGAQQQGSLTHAQAMATAAALAAAAPHGLQQLPSAWRDAAAATAARGLGLGTAGSGGSGGAFNFGPGGVGASLRAAAAAVAAAAAASNYPQQGATAQPQQPPPQQVSRLMPAPPPRLGVLVAAGQLMASRAPLGSAFVADAAAAAAASVPPGVGSDGNGSHQSSAELRGTAHAHKTADSRKGGGTEAVVE